MILDLQLYIKKIIQLKIISVNEYYTPKFNHVIENHSNVKENKDLTEPHKEENDQSINMFNEFHKIAMNEFESRRKMQVQSKLNKKFTNWECKRREYASIAKGIDEKFKYSPYKTLVIDRNYSKKLQDNDNDQFQSRLLEEQSKLIDQKTKSIKFALVLNNASNLLNKIKILFSNNHISPQLQLLNKQYMVYESDVQKLKNQSGNSFECDLLALNQLFQNIEVLYNELVKNIENISLKSDSPENEKNNLSSKNFEFKINENNDEYIDNLESNPFKSEETKSEIQNFTFKVDDNSEIKSDEFFTFKFKTNEKEDDTIISNFSFKIEDLRHKEIKNNTKSYNFETDYKQFIENHLELQQYLKQIEKSYSSFLHDDNLKSLRQELIKSINTPVNSISSVSSWHMKDKFDKLDALLNCKTVKTGNSTVSANSHPDALIFCKDTLAKKIINIGEQVASVKTETAFEVASIVTELWKIHPDFGILLYSRFKQKCPCLIPYNAAKTNEETDEEYYKSLCYNYTNGVVEKQDKYVKRMTGIIRLFAAIIVTETKSGKVLGIGQAWMLIAATVNLVPQLDVTAVFLHEMLVITGYNLKKAYGRQFMKMLQYINSNYLKKIDEVTPVGCGGPVQRLKTFISKVIEVGYIEKPKGIIPYKFW
ncbi:nucleoporin GLE1-like isoform X2 [Sipha flava]|uniref:mRNA export factor GLE1 n=1 Tax=Sipha flava TaxID=143950 RepID=A0A8B8FQY4_9HEMI|nr:nucleoporin GLE1-like isoform X2 [Sipha flava]